MRTTATNRRFCLVRCRATLVFPLNIWCSRVTKQKTIFISYSHNDQEFVDRFLVHLKPLEKLYSIISWSDGKIRPGKKWKDEIESKLESADAVIVLLSADFLASEFVMEFEYPKMLAKAEENGALLIVVLASPCEYRGFEIGDYQMVNTIDNTLQDNQSDDRAADQERIYVKCIQALKDHFGVIS